MKKKILPLLMALFLFSMTACKNDGKPGPGEEILDKDTSYAFGMLVASEFRMPPGFSLNYNAFTEGYKAAVNEEAKFSTEEAVGKLELFFMTAMAGQTQGLQEQEAQFLEENSRKPGIAVTPSGLQYEVKTQGMGRKPSAADVVRVHYRGTLTDGTPFDSSYDRGEPAEFSLQQVIPGWTEGLQLMNEGGSYRFYIPSRLGYGDRGTQNIPPYAPLIFDVELLTIISN